SLVGRLVPMTFGVKVSINPEFRVPDAVCVLGALFLGALLCRADRVARPRWSLTPVSRLPLSHALTGLSQAPRGKHTGKELDVNRRGFLAGLAAVRAGVSSLLFTRTPRSVQVSPEALPASSTPLVLVAEDRTGHGQSAYVLSGLSSRWSRSPRKGVGGTM